ncbi:MAG: thioredoxin family protein [Balneola sp.]|nr:thioredoxin family protein [Balneola sp.]MBO6650063.1 thioredoxin family protein [Balneola sp.]MBO6711587.1 thioredoxin family protein [Balneola sp.]MBO6799783.1 thioredoxin family protein [Balneola sp.]MBO6870776.1 thioredoxin family protein [Balneola sp.]
MKLLRLTILLLLAFLSAGTTLAQESSVDSGVEWQSLEEAQKKAKESGKKVLIFGYADWCTYCMKMRKETYPEENVQKSLSDDFIPVQINGESEEEIVFNGKTYKSYELARYLRLTSYPTHYFLDSEGKIIGAQPGFLPADVFSPLMNYVSEDLFGKVPFLDYMEKKGIKLEQEQD